MLIAETKGSCKISPCRISKWQNYTVAPSTILTGIKGAVVKPIYNLQYKSIEEKEHNLHV